MSARRLLVSVRNPAKGLLRSSYGAVISPYIDELYDYQHPFRVEHMHHVLNVLLPHVRRFRSLAILTDRWAPMQTALDCLSMELPGFVSAPRPLPPKALPMQALDHAAGYMLAFGIQAALCRTITVCPLILGLC